MSNKTTRKNRTDLTVNWPTKTEYFTVTDLFDANPDFIRITLRVRLKKAIDEAKSVAVIGSKKGDKGRPSLVYAMTPVNQEVIDKARSNGVDIIGESDMVKVLEITPVIDTTPVSTSTTVTTSASTTVVH